MKRKEIVIVYVEKDKDGKEETSVAFSPLLMKEPELMAWVVGVVVDTAVSAGCSLEKILKSYKGSAGSGTDFDKIPRPVVIHGGNAENQ